MVTDDRMEKALRYMAETDEPCATLKADMERAEFKAKAIKDAVFLRLEGTVAERTAQAGSSDEYSVAMEAYFGFVAAFEKVRNKRNTESLVIDVWRSINANRRQG